MVQCAYIVLVLSAAAIVVNGQSDDTDVGSGEAVEGSGVVADEGSGVAVEEGSGIDADTDATDYDYGSGLEDASGDGSGDSLAVGSDTEEGSGENETATESTEEEEVISEEAVYSMNSEDGLTQVELVMQRIGTGLDMNMLCTFNTEDTSLFEGGRYPEIWLVAGNSRCTNLEGTVNAQKIADILDQGEAAAHVAGLQWTDLTGSCLTVLRSTESSGDSAADAIEDDDQIVDVGEESGSGDLEAEGSGEGDEGSGRQGRVDGSILRMTGPGRSFITIDLSSFRLISAGFSSTFTSSVSVYKPQFTFSVPYFTPTKSDPFATLPLLQLPGFDGSTAFYIVWGMIMFYYTVSYIYSQKINLNAIAQKFASRTHLVERLDRMQERVGNAVYNVLNKINPYRPDYNYYDSYPYQYDIRRADDAVAAEQIRKIDEFEYEYVEDTVFDYVTRK